MDSRQYGKKFPGCLKENARPSLSRRWSFYLDKPVKKPATKLSGSESKQNWPLLNRVQIRSKMVKLHSSEISLLSLILCLCLGSLVSLPIFNAVGAPAIEISEVNPESFNLFNQAEFDEEFSILTIVSATTAGLVFSKLKPINLAFQTIYLLPHFPPPKHT
jgi:hypothetical protein